MAIRAPIPSEIHFDFDEIFLNEQQHLGLISKNDKLCSVRWTDTWLTNMKPEYPTTVVWQVITAVDCDLNLNKCNDVLNADTSFIFCG